MTVPSTRMPATATASATDRVTVHAGPAGTMTRAMRHGLHLIGLLLVVVAAARAIGDGAAPWLAAAVAVAFLAWYTIGALLGTRLRERRHVYSWVGGLATIWIGAIAVSAEFIWLAFLLWLLAGRFLSLRGAILFSVIVFALVGYAPLFHHGATTYATVFGPLIGAIFAVGISRGYLQLLHDAAERESLVASLTRTQEELIDLQDELALTQRHSGMETERIRIARDMHDTVAQTLPSMRFIAHAAVAGDEPDAMRRALGQVETLAAEAVTDVRRIVAALAPAELDRGALGAALARMLQRLRAETGIATELHVDDTLPGLPGHVEVALLRTAQSALANVRRHADADRVTVSLIDGGDTVRLDIIDDGRGFDPASRRTPSGADDRGYGLGFIDGRLRELGGGLDLDSRPGAGTELSAHLPLRPIPQEDS